MKVTASRYSIIISIQSILLITDWMINIFALAVRQSNVLMLTLFILQDTGLIISVSLLLLTFFSTFVFQAGLVYVLYERFRTALIICMLYFISTTILHIWVLFTTWGHWQYHWNLPFSMFFIFQRFAGILYYYYYKRASLRISDPRFYEDIDLESHRLNNH